jgi:hypothetical protein
MAVPVSHYGLIQSSCRSFIRVIVPYEISKVNFRVETKILVSMRAKKNSWDKTAIFLSAWRQKKKLKKTPKNKVKHIYFRH